jgi:thiosulfate reductase cytochrome b subunit
MGLSMVAPAFQQAVPMRRPLVKRYGVVVRLTHWLNALLLVGMIASGLQIYNAYRHFGLREMPLAVPNPLGSQAAPEWARLGGWLALAWPFVITGLVYIGFLVVSGEWRTLLFRPRDIRPAIEMQAYYLRLRREHPSQGKHNALQKLAYTLIVALGAVAALSGFAIYKPVQLAWLTTLFGGYELARYWHFVAVWLFVGFTLLHVVLVFLADPSSLRGMITGWYRGRFPSHD